MLLSHALRRSTIAAGDLRFPVRDGMEREIPRHGHQAKQDQLVTSVLFLANFIEVLSQIRMYI